MKPNAMLSHLEEGKPVVTFDYGHPRGVIQNAIIDSGLLSKRETVEHSTPLHSSLGPS